MSTHPKFAGDPGFQIELRRRIAEFFEQSKRRPRDCPAMYAKSAILILAFATIYVLLVFAAQSWWQAVPLSIALGLATAAIGLNVQHDGGHDAYSDRKWVNATAAAFLDLIGGSSYVWHYRHSVLHHTYVNITGHDTDIDLGALGRLTPYQRRLPIHRWQHWYMWPLYGLMAIRWQLFGDFADVLRGRVSGHPMPRPRGWNLVVFIMGKGLFLTLAFGLPMLFHPWLVVLFCYAVAGMVLGSTLSVVFQLSHVVEEAEFVPPTSASRIENAWAIHQVESTVDFARESRVVAWLLGGLNFQIEHHLFPRICHIHYRAMAPIVEETCRRFGVKYQCHRSIPAGIASHFRWLRRMGRPDAPQLQAAA